ncbi:CDP-diacylglycerol--inositol 3-phosphatidyltransferase [Nadsonia fulvescens var. elongata DSM 6958]|uniref:CDP-diacylglycerol--inositol 3-phosphatidyltransferase n=1 Tax=Nadsonia fulvescens var. elongata DSM 6958 TaxID=857566 RepID=A0A1E3PIH7_9ASCO|nr:CDP-diacylglycerol--inositol 3-phosphatidyltransferase [Nadsonia fulvescens var. elongata DSM 6958]
MSSTKQLTTTDIFLYIPNLIGYVRVVLALASLFYMQWHPKYCTVLYGVSCLLDALDGHAARKFNQTSKFGAILDMVTDRCTTSCLICYLCVAYPNYAVVFQLLTSLDLASHYMHMYATLSSGSASHKKVDQKTSWILNLYYTNNIVLFLFCAFNELFFVAIYLLSFPVRENSYNLGYLFGFPLSFPLVFAIITFPLWLGKQIINVVQMIKAAVMLAEGDVEERAEKTQ